MTLQECGERFNDERSRYPLVGLELYLATAEGEDGTVRMYGAWRFQICPEMLRTCRCSSLKQTGYPSTGDLYVIPVLIGE